MHFRSLLLLLLAVLLPVLTYADIGTEPQPIRFDTKQVRVAVLSYADLLPASRIVEYEEPVLLPPSFADALIEALNAKNRFSIVEREVIRRAFNEQAMTARRGGEAIKDLFAAALENISEVKPGTVAELHGITEQNTLMRELSGVGTAIGADYLVFLKLEASEQSLKDVPLPGGTQTLPIVDSYARAHVRVVEVQHGTIEAAKLVELKHRSAKTEHLERLLAEKVAGTVLEAAFPKQVISTAPLLINRGSVDGITPGTRYTLHRRGEPVKDEAGITIGYLQSPVGEAMVTEVGPTFAKLRALGPAPQLGDRLEQKSVAQGEGAQPEQRAKLSSDPSFEEELQQDLAALSGTTRLPRLAIAPIKVGQHVDPNEKETVTEQLADVLTSGFQASGKYSVIERARLQELITEQDFDSLSRGDDTDLSNLTGIDLLVVISVPTFKFTQDQRHIAILGKEGVIQRGEAQASVRLVSTKTGEIQAAKIVEVTANHTPDRRFYSSPRTVLVKKLASAISAEISGGMPQTTTIHDSKPRTERNTNPVNW